MTRVSVEQGDEFTLTAVLTGRDYGETFPMYAVQYNLWYDESMFQLVPESVKLGKDRDTGITISTFTLSGQWAGWKEIAASAYSSRTSGDTWKNPTELMTFRLKAIHSGMSTIFARRADVSTPDGMSAYSADSNDVTITVLKISQDSEKQDVDEPETSEGSGEKTPEQDQPVADTPPDGDERSSENDDRKDTDIDHPSEPSAEKSDQNPLQPVPGDDGAKTADYQNESEDAKSDENNLWIRFRDIPEGAWYIESVNYALEKNIFQGTGEETFSPEASMTRAMLVTVLHRMEGCPEVSGKSSYTDVPEGQWYSKAVDWADCNGVVNGYGNGRFGPADSVTRQQIAVILYRYAEKKGLDIAEKASLDSFRDAAVTADWAYDAIGWAVQTGILNGMDDGILAPSGTATRAQVATMLMRYDRLRV